MASPKKLIKRLLAEAGIEINGNRSFDIRVYNESLYGRILTQGSLGLGEAYMDGWWDCARLDLFFYRVLSCGLDKKIRFSPGIIWYWLNCLITNQQTLRRARKVGEKHYDLGHSLYLMMLDYYMTYSCGYWKEALDLDHAQEKKLDLICRKLHLKGGEHILDIGGGWGSFARFASERYNVSVDAITISQEQASHGRKLCRDLPIKILLQDYRQIAGQYDHIVSVGMVEHVGYKNYRSFMRIVSEHLKPGGLFLLHTIGRDRPGKSTDRWIEKYIFPNSMIPSIEQLDKASRDYFVMEDWHNFGADYDLTLLAWEKNFQRFWGSIKNGSEGYDQRFFRMWEYYLLSCAGSFRARKNQLWQIVYSPGGVTGGYDSVR